MIDIYLFLLFGIELKFYKLHFFIFEKLNRNSIRNDFDSDVNLMYCFILYSELNQNFIKYIFPISQKQIGIKSYNFNSNPTQKE